ncbi:MAG TPA: penicillin acylase family protein [Micropepsaceae bacterium]|nr:penicillin acylase family protein [Micropepsaceae bacterium]
MIWLKRAARLFLFAVTVGIFIVLIRDAQLRSFDAAPHLAAASAYDVRIMRDEFGVPHIYGKHDADVAFGLAYAHAEDDFATIAETIMLARGRLAEWQGEKAARFDYMVDLFGISARVNARYETDIPAETRAVVEAYAAGINLYVAEHPELAGPGLMPVTGKDVVAGFVLRTPFFYGLGRMIEELGGATTRPHPVSERNAADIFPGLDGHDIGSNAAALSPLRSADGATRLLVNSHQPWDGPVAWYEVRVKSEEGWDMAGGVFPGSPFVLHGAGPALGWANTVNRVDLADIYVLTINPENENQYQLDGVWRDFEIGEAAITVKLFGPLRWTFYQPTVHSAFGPVLRLSHGTYAIRFAGMDEVRQVSAYHRLNRAINHAEFEAALRMQALPSLNFLYADRTGRIAFYHNGTFPDRKAGLNWRDYLPGDQSDLIWTRFLPFEAVPRIIDPASGYLVNGNSSPFLATRGPGSLDPASFPEEMGLDLQVTNRVQRFLDLFEADTSISGDEFIAIKMDRTYGPAGLMADLRNQILAMDFGGDPLLVEAQKVLADWNLRADLSSRGMALALMTATPVLLPLFEGKPRGDITTHLRQSAEELKAHFGRIDPAWREVNIMRRGSFAAPLAGAFDTLRAVEYELTPERRLKLREDGTLIPKGGDSYILVATWDADGGVAMRAIHNYGSATLDAASPHYADQAPLFASEQWKTIWLDEADLRPHITREYRPGR